MLKTLPLAIKLLWREWLAGEWYIVFFALLLAMTAIIATHFYTDRLMRGLDQQSAIALGGDLVISSPSPLPKTWKEKAITQHLRVAEVWSYPSVVSAKNQLQLVNLQAVSTTYPLIGNHAIRLDHDTIWVESRLLSLLQIKINDTVVIGAANFRVEKILTADSDMLNTGWTISPRVLMRLDDVAATRTVLPGSRVDYRLLLVGDKNQLRQFRLWIAPQLQPGQLLLDRDNQQSTLKTILQQTDNYLQLILLVCVTISGVAIGFSMQYYLRRHYNHVALWRCFGASKQQIVKIFLWQLFIISLVAGTIAVFFGIIVQQVFANLFKHFFQFPLPEVSRGPIILGLITSIFLLFLFSFPVINQLPQTSPLNIWRDKIVVHSRKTSILLFFSWGIIFLFFYWLMNFSQLAFYFISLLLISVAVLYGLSLLMLALLRFISNNTEGTIRQGLSQLIHQPKNFSLQFIGFNVILILLMVFSLIKTDLIKQWQQSLPRLTPNYFAFNIAPTDVDHLTYFLKQQRISIAGIYPMVRGRLIELNNNPILTSVPKDALSNNALHRELNLSWMWQFPADNKIVAGIPWTLQDEGKSLVSVENKLAATLGLQLGDELTFQVGDQKIHATITNFRTLNWSSFHPNFFMIFPPGLFNQLPTTYITSFHLSSKQTDLLNQLVHLFPNITVVDVANLLKQLQDVIATVTTAMQYLFLFGLGTGILIFVACLIASMDERYQTYYLWRVLGAGKKYIRKSIIAEFACLMTVILFTTISVGFLLTFFLENNVFTR